MATRKIEGLDAPNQLHGSASCVFSFMHQFLADFALKSTPPRASTSPRPPTDDAIEAIIQQATSARPSPDGRPLRDTRTQLFVGNVRLRFLFWFPPLPLTASSCHIVCGGRTSRIFSERRVRFCELMFLWAPTTDHAVMAPFCSPPQRMLVVQSTCSMATRGRPEFSKSASTGSCPI